ncbi:MAG: sel1 repeat family protein [Tissierellia bacterium]|nr:sel1 repeat family protein [Tissierellia bacterium]
MTFKKYLNFETGNKVLNLVADLILILEGDGEAAYAEVDNALTIVQDLAQLNKVKLITDLFKKIEPDKSNFDHELSLIYKLYARLHLAGEHLKKDIDVAKKYLTHDLLKDNPKAWFLLGKAHIEEGDHDSALKHLSKAALVGNKEAKHMVDQLLEKGVGNNKGFFETVGLSEFEVARAVKNL